MRTVRTVAELREALAPSRRAGSSIGLVPTMGAFHAGHLSLVRAARADCEVVVVSLFVNPAQFDDPADLDAYPRTEGTDAALAAEEGVDVLFAPAPGTVYPPGFATRVSVGGALTGTLEGAHRGREHFDGVATVVLKLLNMTRPDVAYFGQKDAQQALVIRKLVADLDVGVDIRVRPTVRDLDGLAMSSRNGRLSAAERDRAVVLSRALEVVADLAAGGEEDVDTLVAAGRAELAEVDLEYLAVVSPDSLARLDRLEPGRPALVAVAARVGPVRLIDNLLLHPEPDEVVATPASANRQEA